jgi:hypothetical protein
MICNQAHLLTFNFFHNLFSIITFVYDHREDVISIFERPKSDKHDPIPVDRIDLKRGYAFVFLKDATSQAQKEKAERYVSDMNGM